MLSIGKLATGQANYYLRLADGRVDRATSVASGVEEFAAAGWVDAAGQAAAGGFGFSVHGVRKGEVTVGEGWVDAEVVGAELL